MILSCLLVQPLLGSMLAFKICWSKNVPVRNPALIKLFGICQSEPEQTCFSFVLIAEKWTNVIACCGLSWCPIICRFRSWALKAPGKICFVCFVFLIEMTEMNWNDGNSQSIEGSFHKHGGDHTLPEAERKRAKKGKKHTQQGWNKQTKKRTKWSFKALHLTLFGRKKTIKVLPITFGVPESHEEQIVVQSSLFWDSSRGVDWLIVWFESFGEPKSSKPLKPPSPCSRW